MALIDKLVERGRITPEERDRALKESKKEGLPVERILLKLGLVGEEDLVSLRAEELNVPFIDLANYLVDPEIVKLIPEQVSRKYRLMPLFKIGKTLTIAMANPVDVMALDEARRRSGCDVEPALAVEGAIEDAINQYYGVTGSVSELVQGIDKDKLKEAGGEGKKLAEVAGKAPVIKLVNLIILQAIRERASDIHIEPEEDKLRMRFRVDGLLREGQTLPKHLEDAIASRIKVQAKMDIAETRRPQDGRIQMKVENKAVDLRVSTFPTEYGENLVLRILDRSSLLLSLTDLGFSKDVLAKFEELIQRPNGIILVTGPTGSGKTTTLYAALSKINSVEKNIITIEDPIEYHLDMIRQTQVNPKASLTFASGLRSILRQDPDVIMVGEIRDRETADIAIHSALTGHLVFSTLHTNDAPSAMARLIDMGVEPFLVSSSVIAVLAQRLVRLICEKCKTSYEGSLTDIGKARAEKIRLFKGKGCNKCKDTGYSGRIGVFELLVVSEDIRSLVVRKASTSDLKKKARELGMQTMYDDGLEKVKSGLTTIEEVHRATLEE